MWRFACLSILPFSVLSTPSDDPWGCTDLEKQGAFVPVELSSPSQRVQLTFIPYGGTVQKIIVPDKYEKGVDIVLGFDNASQYCWGTYGDAGHPYFGALIGRVANRIGGGSFKLNNKTYHTPINEPAGNDTLHGGTTGWDRRVWHVSLTNKSSALLSYSSPDGEMGFPGAVDVSVRYTVTDNAWVIEYDAIAKDQDTVIGLTQHTYWNLNGCADTVLEHAMTMPFSDRTLAVNPHLVPTGQILAVDAALDFRDIKPVGKDIHQTAIGGYDNAFVFSNWTRGQEAVPRLVVFSALTGIQLVVATDQPSVQVYSGNSLTGSIPVKNDQPAGRFYEHWGALALEAQNFPDAVNYPSFPSPVLRRGERYRQTTSYSFGIIP